MREQTPKFGSKLAGRHRQHGVVLWISLVVLVVLLAASTLIVRNTTLGQGIAGNLGFKRNATLAGDLGTEAARAWLVGQFGNSEALQQDIASGGYYATWGTGYDDPAAFPWGNAVLAGGGSGNQVRYLIHRMCRYAGPTSGTVPAPAGVLQECVYISNADGDKTGGSQASVFPSAAKSPFYRVTSRVVGPRGTVSFVQSMLY